MSMLKNVGFGVAGVVGVSLLGYLGYKGIKKFKGKKKTFLKLIKILLEMNSLMKT